MVHVPNTLGNSQSRAELVLRSVGLDLVVERKQSTIGVGVVMESDPEAGSLVPRGSTVILIISAG